MSEHLERRKWVVFSRITRPGRVAPIEGRGDVLADPASLRWEALIGQLRPFEAIVSPAERC